MPEWQRNLERLEAEITELWGHISAASYRFLELVAEFDRVKGHEAHGLVTCAQWLNWQCGIGEVAAREKVRVARALESLPRIADAFRRGVISYSKVRAMTRVATPEDEHVLLNTALHGTAAHVERHVRKFRWCQRRDEAAEADDRHRRRYLSCFRDEDGSLVMHAVLPPEIGALVQKAIEEAVDEVDEPASPEPIETPSEASAETPEAPKTAAVETADAAGMHEPARHQPRGMACAPRPIRTRSNVSAESSEDTHEHLTKHDSYGAKRADALRLLAERFLERRAETRGSVADRYQVTVHIDQRLLARSNAAANDVDAEALKHCELEDADRPLAIETARRLACDCSLVGIVGDAHGEPLSVGRKTRAIPPALKRALKVRDGGCRFPGCGRTRFTDGHHVRHWAEGGETKLSNLVTLCRFHHRLVHEGQYGVHAVESDPRDPRASDDTETNANAGIHGVSGAQHVRFVFTRPDGTPVEPNGRRLLRAGAVSRPDGAALEPPADGTLEGLLFELNRQRGLEIDAETSRCGWLGESMDYSMAIEAQQHCREQERGRLGAWP